MSHLAHAVINVDQFYELKNLVNSYSQGLHVQDPELWENSTIHIFLYSNGWYGSGCGKMAGKQFLSTGWDNTMHIALTAGFFDFLEAVKKQLEKCN